MFYGEHLNADEQAIKCTCGVTATVEVLDRGGGLCGWFCHGCAPRKRKELRRIETLARAIVRGGRP